MKLRSTDARSVLYICLAVLFCFSISGCEDAKVPGQNPSGGDMAPLPDAGAIPQSDVEFDLDDQLEVPPESSMREGTTPCGPEEEGRLVQEEVEGSWVDTALCLLGEDGGYGEVNFGAGYAPAEWDYDQADFPARGVYGWSYYIRAFDLIRDTPVAEVGWGQWSKPAVPADGLSVCGIHPHGLVCEDAVLDEESIGCGYSDWQSLESCRAWCCAEEDRCGVRGSIEGGMGYWMYTLATPQVKWMLPGATNANYETFGGTFLHDRPQPCTSLGGAVRIPNNLVVPNDFVSFEGDDVDGFLGYMLTRTPIGKRSPTDNANSWTIIVDAANFAGPVMFISSWFWDSRINWHPESVSWSDPRALVGYIAEGFEGRVGTITVVDGDGVEWRRTNRWAFPQDIASGGGYAATSTLFTGHSQYNTDWASVAVEPMLSGTGASADRSSQAVLSAALARRSDPGGGCNKPDYDFDLNLELEHGDGETIWEGFGVGGVVDDAALELSQKASCHTRLDLDVDKLDCETKPGRCEGSRYLMRDPGQESVRVLAENEVPSDIRHALDVRTFVEPRVNDGRFLGPPNETEKACFDMPGPAPADSRLYCTRTQNGTWIGFRWYRFVDQPELNQVFASLPEGERDEAKCFMQARIERLHQAQADSAEPAQWFDAPQGAENLPGPKVSFDPALLVEPPSGLEVGFVPIPVIERKREKPDGCDVILGDVAEEPDPLPQGYYEGKVREGGTYDEEVCFANGESAEPYTYPGTIFPYDAATDQSRRTPYAVPTRDSVAGVLSATSLRCGLPSDPPMR